MSRPEREREPHEEQPAPERDEREYEPGYERPGPSVIKINRLINYAFVVLEGLIGIRVLLTVLGANPANAFVSFVYTLTFPFVSPFLTVFNGRTVSTGIGVLEFGSLLAIAFLILLNYAIVRFIWILASRNSS
jgi:YggT family protein